MIKETELTRGIDAVAGLDFHRAHAALDSLGVEVGTLEYQVKAQERQCKRVWSGAFLSAEGSVEARKAQAEIDPHYERECRKLAMLEKVYMPKKRRYETLKMGIETGRTLVSYQKKVLEQLG